MSKPRVRSITRTIRIDEDIDGMLVRLSDREKISVNQLVGSALRTYTEWDTLANTIGLVHIHDKTVAKLFENITEEKARELGHDSGMNAWTEMVAYLFKTLNYGAVLKMLELRGRYGRWFIFEHSSDKDVDTLILKHRQGSRVTAFFAEAVKVLLARTGIKFVLAETEEQLMVKVYTKQKPVVPEPWPFVKAVSSIAGISRPANTLED